MAKSTSAAQRAAASPSDQAICRVLAEKFKSNRLEFAFVEDVSGTQPRFSGTTRTLNDEERDLLARLTDDVRSELILHSLRKGLLVPDHWRTLAAAGLRICLNLQNLNLPIAARRRGYLHAAATEAAKLFADPPATKIEDLKTMMDAERCVYWELPASFALEALSKEDKHANNSDVEKVEKANQSSRRAGAPASEFAALRVPAASLTPGQFLARELAFFDTMIAARPRLSAEELKESLQAHLQDSTVVGKNYGDEVNQQWVHALSEFLEATGLRIKCIGAHRQGEYPSLPRYLQATGGRYYQFKTKHNDEEGKQRHHGGPTAIPLFTVIYAELSTRMPAK